MAPIIPETHPAPSMPYRAKLLSNPETREALDEKFSVRTLDGRYAQPNRLVELPDEEKQAQADGFTEEIPAPVAGEPFTPFEEAQRKDFLGREVRGVPGETGDARTARGGPLEKKLVTLLIGSRPPAEPENPYAMPDTKPVRKQQSAHVNHHDTVADILKQHKLATDGTMVMLAPGTKNIFAMDDLPYRVLENHQTVEVMPLAEALK